MTCIGTGGTLNPPSSRRPDVLDKAWAELTPREQEVLRANDMKQGPPCPHCDGTGRLPEPDLELVAARARIHELLAATRNPH